MPHEKKDPILTGKKINTLEKLKEFAIKNIGTRFTTEELASAFTKATGIYTNENFIKTHSKPYFGKQLHELLIDKRLEIGAEEILKGEKKISEISKDIGMDEKWFLTCFKNKYKETPNQYRRNRMNKPK